jgi:uncharacterized protein (TIGR01777 family)
MILSDRRGKIIIPGGTGYLGKTLTTYFNARGFNVIVLSRSSDDRDKSARFVHWDGEHPGAWTDELEGAIAVVNMAGRSVDCRYTARNKAEIYDSRLRSTRVIGEAIAQCAKSPKVWLNSSSATIYRHAVDREMDEATGEIGTGFSVDVCQRWEQTLADAPTPHTRKVALRSAIVFGKRSEALRALRRIVNIGLGGMLGSGAQFVSWIHAADFARAVHWLIEHEELEGAFNLAAPNPVTNREFMRTLREVYRQPLGLPAAKWMLEIGAFFLRTETELVLKSRRVVPTRLLESGFDFEHTHFHSAIKEIVGGGVAEV